MEYSKSTLWRQVADTGIHAMLVLLLRSTVPAGDGGAAAAAAQRSFRGEGADTNRDIYRGAETPAPHYPTC